MALLITVISQKLLVSLYLCHFHATLSIGSGLKKIRTMLTCNVKDKNYLDEAFLEADLFRTKIDNNCVHASQTDYFKQRPERARTRAKRLCAKAHTITLKRARHLRT